MQALLRWKGFGEMEPAQLLASRRARESYVEKRYQNEVSKESGERREGLSPLRCYLLLVDSYSLKWGSRKQEAEGMHFVGLGQDVFLVSTCRTSLN